MANGDIYKVGLKAQLAGQLYVMTPHVQEIGVNLNFMEDLGAWVEDWLDTNMKPKVAGNCKWDTIEIRNITQPTIGLDYPVDITGNRASEPLPNQVSMVVSLRSSLIGRRYRGRLYVGGLCEDVSDSGTWNSAFRQGMETIWEDWLNISFGVITNAKLVVYSRTYEIATPVEYVSISQYPGVQRRRRFGQGA